MLICVLAAYRKSEIPIHRIPVHWPIRVGIHTGPVIAGYSGGSFDVWGDTVNIAARMESSGDAGKVHISEMTRAFVDHSEKIVDRGMTDLKNKGPIHTYFIDG